MPKISTAPYSEQDCRFYCIFHFFQTIFKI
nr:MAG TPA: hypothetical protein [Caudoviricetes sp.]